jgi:hypothetical protein
MYRPPSTPLRVFFQQFYDLLLNFCKNGEILLLGDFNTPFSSNLTTNYNLTMLLSEFSLTQHVQDATHIKDLLVTLGNLILKVLAAKVWNNLPQILRTENRFLLFMTTLTHEKMLFYILTHYKHSEISEPPYAHSNTESSTEPIFHHETTKKDVLQNV